MSLCEQWMPSEQSWRSSWWSLRQDWLAQSLNKGKCPEKHMADIEVNRKQVRLALWEHSWAGKSWQAETPFLPGSDVIWGVFINNHVWIWNLLEKRNLEVKHFCPNVHIIQVRNKNHLLKECMRLRLSKIKQEPIKPVCRDMTNWITVFGCLKCSAKPKIEWRNFLKSQASYGKKNAGCLVLWNSTANRALSC